MLSNIEKNVLSYIIENLPKNPELTLRDIEESGIEDPTNISGAFQSLSNLGYIFLDNRLKLHVGNKCIQCNKMFYNRDFYPFCSERCQLVDLYDWIVE
jgi:hypothetical protein